MVRTGRGILATLALILALGVVAGCSQSDPEEAVTPEGSATIVNTAPQTNEQGETVPAPTDTGAAPGGEAPGGGTETADGGAAPPGDGGGAEPVGDVAAGETFFAGTCVACHLNNGRDAGGVGPQLAGAGVTEEVARTTIQNGRGAMPGGLASDEDLDNVVAYVLSLQ